MVKQMRIKHFGGLPEEERRLYRQVIYRNVLESAHAIIDAMLNIGLVHPNQVCPPSSSFVRRS
jgi:guanine nucleotide-binding protein G(i) subunit alpha